MLSLPLRLGVRAATAVVEETVVLGARAAGLLADLIAPRQRPSPAAAPDVSAPPDVAAVRPDVSAPPDVAAAAHVSVPPVVPASPAAAAPAVSPAHAPLPDEAPVPVPPPEPAHVSEEPELVREEADPGAEEGAGAQLRVAEPWAGYHLMNARDVIDRLVSATPEELAAVELYERSHRRRKTVVAAAERALKLAAPPGRQTPQPSP